jgi:hypothetical protein
MFEGWSSEALPGLIGVALAFAFVVWVIWFAVVRPFFRYARRTPCGHCGLSCDRAAPACPHCGTSREVDPSRRRRSGRRRRSRMTRP